MLLRFRKGTHKRNAGMVLYWDAVLAVKLEVNNGYCSNSPLDCPVTILVAKKELYLVRTGTLFVTLYIRARTLNKPCSCNVVFLCFTTVKPPQQAAVVLVTLIMGQCPRLYEGSDNVYLIYSRMTSVQGNAMAFARINLQNIACQMCFTTELSDFQFHIPFQSQFHPGIILRKLDRITIY